MAPFAGYDMPISYATGAIEEHAITRRSVGLFDIDHMGQFEISGPGADEFVSHLVSAKVLDMVPPMARYSLLLDEKGCVIDDLFVYRMLDAWWIVVNASNRDTDLAWFTSRADMSVKIVDKSDKNLYVADQGPKAIDCTTRSPLRAVSTSRALHVATSTSRGFRHFGRTGYTGEDGGELFFPLRRRSLLGLFP